MPIALRPVLALCVLSLSCSGSSSPVPKAKAQPTPKDEAEAAAEAPEAPEAKEPNAGDARAQTWTFDDAMVGQVPAGMRITETGGAGTPATWEVVADDTAPTQPHAFAITETGNGKPTYNLALVEGTRYADVDVSVMVKAGTGVLDQGGGPIWRVQDADNYYIARWNPLENNARFYIVRGGVRTALAKVELELDAEAWHALRVVMEGTRMELFIDDKPVLTAESDEIPEAGMVGLWTKADAATSFDDLSVTEP